MITRSTRFLILIGLSLPWFLCGCQLPPARQNEKPDAAVAKDQAQRFASVPPEQLDSSLKQEQLDKMFVPLPDVSFEEPDFHNECKQSPPEKISERPAETKGSAETEGSVRIGQKAYLRGRWLLKEATGRGKNSKELCGQAIEEISRSLAVDPNNASLNQILAEAYYAIGREDKALCAAARSIELNPDGMKSYLILANIQYNRRLYSNVGFLLRRALICPQAVESNSLTAIAHLQMGSALKEMEYLTAAAYEYHLAWQLLNRQRGYAHSSEVTARFVASAHMPILAKAHLELRMGLIGRSVETLREAQAALPVRGSFLKIFVMTLTQQKLSLQTRYRQITAMCRYLLATSGHPEVVLDVFYGACSALSKYKSYLDNLEQWYADGGDGNGEQLLSPRLYAYGLALADSNDQAEQILTGILSQRKPPESPKSAEIALVHRDLARLYGKVRRWSQMILSYGAYVRADSAEMPGVLTELKSYLPEIADLPVLLRQWRGEDRFCSDSDICFLLGYIAENGGVEAPAEDFYRRALAIEPGFAAARSRLIRLLLNIERYDEVLAYVEQNGDDPELLRYAGRACLEMGRLERAGSYYRRLIDLQEDNVSAYLALGEVLYKQGAFERSEEILLRVLADWPGRLEVYRRLAVLYIRWSDQPNLAPKMSESLEKRSQLMLGQYIRQDSERETAVDRKPAVERADLIIADMEKLALEYPRGIVVGTTLGRLYEMRDRGRDALKQIEQLLEVYPQNERVLAIAAEFNEKYGDTERACLLREQLWRIRPDDPLLLLACSRTMRRAGRSQDALQLLMEGTSREPWRDNTEVVETLQIEALRLFMITRNYTEAVELFQKWYDLMLGRYEPEQPSDDSHTAKQKTEDAVETTSEDAIQNVIEDVSQTIAEDAGQATIEDAGQTVAQETDRVDVERPLRTAGGNLIWALTEAGFYDRAVSHAEALYQRFGSDSDKSILWLIRAFNVRLQFDRSGSLLENLLRMEPEDISLRLLLYLTIIERGEGEKSLAEAEKWAAEKPGEKKRLRMLLLLLRRVGDYDKAVELLRQAISESPYDEGLEIILVDTLLEAGKYDRAEEIISSREQGKKDKHRWFDFRIKLDMGLGMCRRACERVERAAGGNADSVGVRKLKVQILDTCGESQEALELQKEIVQSDPCDPGARLRLSIILDKMGQTTEAIEQLEMLLALQPDSPGLMNNLGYQLVQSHREPQRALELLERSLGAEPDSAATLDSAGWYYYKCGRFDKALEYLYQAAALMSVLDEEILEHLGDTVYRLGRREQARSYWRQARERLRRQARIEQNLEVDKVRIEKKLQLLEKGEEVLTAPLFDEKRRTETKTEI